MSQCVPSWDLDDAPPRTSTTKLAGRPHSSSYNSLPPDVPTLDYEVAELTWENGQLAMHGLGPPRGLNKSQTNASSPTKYVWEKPRAGGTLESIVNQATRLPSLKSAVDGGNGDELVPWFHQNGAFSAAAGGAAAGAMTMDALVPCSNNSARNDSTRSARVGSCGGATDFDEGRTGRGEGSEAVPPEWSQSSRADHSVSATGSATCGRDSRQVTVDTCEREFFTGEFGSTSSGSPENTSSGKHSVSHNQPQSESHDEENKIKKTSRKFLASTKRSRAAAIHNQSERKRRDKINQRMKTLQKMVPNASKTDKASMLDEVIEYLKQLQAQIQMMSRMAMSPMMLPMALQQQQQQQQQLQMSMMGMGMGLAPMMSVMDMNTISRLNLAGIPPVLHHPAAAFMPLAPLWDGSSGDRIPAPVTDPLSAFLACQSQPITMDAYSRMAALYQQLHQASSGPGSKNSA